MTTAGEWLSSHNRFARGGGAPWRGRARTVAVASGKGGVGKTSVALKVARILSRRHRTLLIDCDANLSNTAIKLGLPVTSRFRDLLEGRRPFAECVHREGGFHLLPACSGEAGIQGDGADVGRFIIDLVEARRGEYEYVLLDCSAGVSPTTLGLCAHCDDRFVVVVPDRSSVTDSYSLVKLLARGHGVLENHLVVNKASDLGRCRRVVSTMVDTVEGFLGGRMRLLGRIPLAGADAAGDFDAALLGGEGSALHRSFVKLVDRYTEGLAGDRRPWNAAV